MKLYFKKAILITVVLATFLSMTDASRHLRGHRDLKNKGKDEKKNPSRGGGRKDPATRPEYWGGTANTVTSSTTAQNKASVQQEYNDFSTWFGRPMLPVQNPPQYEKNRADYGQRGPGGLPPCAEGTQTPNCVDAANIDLTPPEQPVGSVSNKVVGEVVKTTTVDAEDFTYKVHIVKSPGGDIGNPLPDSSTSQGSTTSTIPANRVPPSEPKGKPNYGSTIDPSASACNMSSECASRQCWKARGVQAVCTTLEELERGNLSTRGGGGTRGWYLLP